MLDVFNEQKEVENYSSNLNEDGITNTIVLLPKADGYRSRSDFIYKNCVVPKRSASSEKRSAALFGYERPKNAAAGRS